MRGKQLVALGVALAFMPATAHAAEQVTVNKRLKDRREVAAGTRAYSVGFEDGRFYANGWHITGEMGGIWAPPLKLADGIWFGLDDDWVGPATKFTSGRGYVRYSYPAMDGLLMQRTDFVPDGRRAVLYGFELANPTSAAKTVTVKVDVHSELLGAYPWSSTTPGAAGNLADVAAYENGGLTFTDRGTPAGGEAHDYTALVASTRVPDAGETGPDHRGPQPGAICKDGDESVPSVCDDGPFGKGAGGQLRYKLTLGSRTAQTVWVAVAGSDQGVAAARKELAAALVDPDAQLAAKIAERDTLAARSVVDLPGNRKLQEALDWGKQNLADLTQTATNLKIRFVDQGKAFPAPVHNVKRATFIGAGFPDYPWLFATDGEYTAFPAVALGQFEAIKNHLSALREVSDDLNANSGKVAHEIVTDGSVYFGANTDPGNTDESVKFPSAVALVWRWTGDDRFRDRLYDFSRRTLRYVTGKLDADKDGWPEGLGNVERTGMGEEKLDNAVYLIRGLYDFADMARDKKDKTNEKWATDLANKLRAKFEDTWWDEEATQYADSLKGDQQVEQQHWIGVTPMEAELTLKSGAAPGLADAENAATALDQRAEDCFSGTDPLNLGLFHTGCEGGPDGKGEQIVYSLTSSIAAVGNGNYGRLGDEEQRRYTDANALPMLEPDEMPGALPEILPSPGQDANIDRCWTCRSMFMQAWGQYGIAWPVIHQQLGVRPSLGTGKLELLPQVPDGQTRVAGKEIRLGDGKAAVEAQHKGSRYTTTTTVDAIKGLTDLRVGATLASGEEAKTVTLDGAKVKKPTVRETNRGVEVSVKTPVSGKHVVVVTAG
ncbi:hypothetical protein OM076_23945 [Solirubrobacter ginsenosidimutans]|uniref:Glycogen debranching protein n=1 Tax=Solirubrobacter ginsenosidimutans TaxID=490573 RepID=A0A9X3S2C0_9ACTN|nr:hypothetical protein [Solirubrobacter ginsenosidimutans]MDA0163349.1 hypothetical protein [Solirubrobacter ginsenosidimutans]